MGEFPFPARSSRRGPRLQRSGSKAGGGLRLHRACGHTTARSGTWPGGSAVRIAVLFLALFACTVVAAFAVTYMPVREEIVSHLRLNIVAGADAITARLAHEPRSASPGYRPSLGGAKSRLTMWGCKRNRNIDPKWCSLTAAVRSGICLE